MQKEQICETRVMIGNDYEISLTAKGRIMTEVAFKRSQYVGAAPVTLADYRSAVSAQALHFDLTARSLKAALSDLALPENLVRELGAALVTGGSLLLYGSTGNGKTSIAERLPRIFTDDSIYIPYSVEISGHIMMVFDPLLHQAVDDQEDNPDPRWLRCRRPMVKVGGEMRADMLDTRVDEVTRICTAPLQVKANNGILLIDDFGRQRITARELLNRWIVPMDRRVDILSLSGTSFEVPFELLVVFATNLALSDLAEDAFMRRLTNKIRIEPLSRELFLDLFRRICAERKLPCDAEMEEYVLQQCLEHCREGLRGCFPNDLTKIIRGIAAFEEREPRVDRADVDEAMKVYFGQ
jgi:predicted ATPase with chaperone activity